MTSAMSHWIASTAAPMASRPAVHPVAIVLHGPVNPKRSAIAFDAEYASTPIQVGVRFMRTHPDARGTLVLRGHADTAEDLFHEADTADGGPHEHAGALPVGRLVGQPSIRERFARSSQRELGTAIHLRTLSRRQSGVCRLEGVARCRNPGAHRRRVEAIDPGSRRSDRPGRPSRAHPRQRRPDSRLRAP